MPTLHRIGAISIRIYADDHRPPHVHIVSAEFEILVSISDGSIIAGKARQSEIREALKWVSWNREYLALKWIALHERG
ncbi:MAG: DUF4160 domain-containing protein [Hyphomicrobiales bacterium]